MGEVQEEAIESYLSSFTVFLPVVPGQLGTVSPGSWSRVLQAAQFDGDLLQSGSLRLELA